LDRFFTKIDEVWLMSGAAVARKQLGDRNLKFQ
jgi:hypothetical protein